MKILSQNFYNLLYLKNFNSRNFLAIQYVNHIVIMGILIHLYKLETLPEPGVSRAAISLSFSPQTDYTFLKNAEVYQGS